MDNLRVVTIDDELLALRRLKLLLNKVPGVEHVGEALCCSDGLKLVEQSRPDVVLLDVQMPGGDGLQLASAVRGCSANPAIIFVSGFEQYALQAFGYAATDYLMKPVERERLARALSRARECVRLRDAESRLSEMQEIAGSLRASLISNIPDAEETDFWLRGSEGYIRLSADNIECVSSEDDYVALHTTTGTHYLRGSLVQFQARVTPGIFIRVHRRWLVKKRSVVAVNILRSRGAEVLLSGGRRIPVGPLYLKRLRSELRHSLEVD